MSLDARVGIVLVSHSAALAEGAAELAAQISGGTVAVIPAGVAIGSPRPDLTTIPLDGVEPSHVVLATRAGDRGRLVAAFRKCAQALLTGS